MLEFCECRTCSSSTATGSPPRPDTSSRRSKCLRLTTPPMTRVASPFSLIAHFPTTSRRSDRRGSGAGAGHLGRDPGAFAPALRMHFVDSAGRASRPGFGEMRGALRRHRGGRVNLTERQRGRWRESAEPTVAVARTAAAVRTHRSFVAAVGNGLTVGVWAGPRRVGQAPAPRDPSRRGVRASRPEACHRPPRLSYVGTSVGRAAALRQLSCLHPAHSRRSVDSVPCVRAHPMPIQGRLATPLQAPRAATSTAPSVKCGPSVQACVSRYGPRCVTDIHSTH